MYDRFVHVCEHVPECAFVMIVHVLLYIPTHVFNNNLHFQLEISEPAELTEEYIYDEVHPKVNVARQAFAKPKGPAGRGPKRMTKPT